MSYHDPPEILIIDDTPENLCLLMEMLTVQGYKIRPAPNGQTGLASARAKTPDLILLDIKMPDVNGLEVCRQLKADPKTAETPIIFISIMDAAEDVVTGFSLGAVDYIIKPLQEAEVLARVKTHLELTFLRRELQQRNQSLVGSLQTFTKLIYPDTAYQEFTSFVRNHIQAETCYLLIEADTPGNFQIKPTPDETKRDNINFEIVRQSLCHQQARLEMDDTTTESLIIIPISIDPGTRSALYFSRPGDQPFQPDDLNRVEQIAKIVTPLIFQQEKHAAENVLSTVRELDLFVGASQKMQTVYRNIIEAAAVSFPVYLQGETGTGKELAAEALHKLSPRRQQPFIAINCATIPHELAEDELFGHEKGAFTGAAELKRGKFELAHGGALFLDEITDLPLDIQAKLLRVIEKNEIWRIGGQMPLPIDTRIIIAASTSLEEQVRLKKFRLDLFHRLNVLKISLPPLRKRTEDIPDLAHYFLEKYAVQMGKKIQGFTPPAMQLLQNQTWPGNVRELENVIARTVVKHRGPNPIDCLADLAPESVIPAAESVPLTLDQMMDQLERDAVFANLQKNNWNKVKTMTELGLSRNRLNRTIERHGLRQ